MDAPTPPAMDSQALAEACAEKMWAQDEASRGLGMRLDRVGPGEAVLVMRVTDRMVNGHKTCHGGFIFTLADSAFAFACNTYDQRSVAQHCAVTYIAPVGLDDVLVARAVEVSRTGRSGIYDVTVTTEQGMVVAEFRGHSRTIPGTLLDAGAAPAAAQAV